MVFIALNIAPHRTFSLCGTIVNEKESGEGKKLGHMQNPVSMFYALDIVKLCVESEVMSS